MITFRKPHRHVAQCGSTNDLAREWARDPDGPAPSGALVTSDFQTRGRGQRGRQWQAGWGQSALMSFVYHLPPAVEAGQLGLVVALAVANALASITDLNPRLKWPNDILLEGRKVAGILVEISPSAPAAFDGGEAGTHPAASGGPPDMGGQGGTSPIISFPLPLGEGGEERPPGLPVQAGRDSSLTAPPSVGAGVAILGIGINVNQERFVGAEEFVYPPTSLRLAVGRPYEVGRVIAAVASALTQWEDNWRRDGFAPVLNECRERLAVGATVRRGGLQAQLVGLAPSGAAQIRLPGGTFAEWGTVD